MTLKHTGKQAVTAMGHNWVLTKTADMPIIANDGMKAGLANNYIPKGDARVIASTRVGGGGESAPIKFSTAKLQKGGDYSFFCSFPGHYLVMQGKLTF